MSLFITSKSGKSEPGIVERLYFPDDDLTVSFEFSLSSSKETWPSGSSLIMSAAFFAGIVVSPGWSIVAPLRVTSSSTSRSVLKSFIESDSHLINMLLKIGSVCFLSATAAKD